MIPDWLVIAGIGIAAVVGLLGWALCRMAAAADRDHDLRDAELGHTATVLPFDCERRTRRQSDIRNGLGGGAA